MDQNRSIAAPNYFAEVPIPGHLHNREGEATMGIFSGIFDSITDFFSESSVAADSASLAPLSSTSSDVSDLSPSMNDRSESSSHSDTSDPFSAWGTSTPNQVACESVSLFPASDFSHTSYGSFDSGISSSSSFDSGSSFSSGFDS
jgi:hypothetical protein